MIDPCAHPHRPRRGHDPLTIPRADYYHPVHPVGKLTDLVLMAGNRLVWRDKLVALEPDKARFCYLLCRTLNAQRVVEAGTSYGVSTLYLAAAIRDNGGGCVIATEYEPSKTLAARGHVQEARLSQYIDLREGDIRHTLQDIEGPIDLLLLDIWTPMARPTIELVAPKMKTGAVIVTDNTAMRPSEYHDLFAFLEDASHGFSTLTLPFDGGLEMSVKVSSSS
jgi:predicted O-methyltransferase YrrM